MTDLVQVKRSADEYINKITSRDALDERTLMEVRWNRSTYSEAIVIVHINRDISQYQLSSLLGYDFTHDRMDIITDYFLRDILNNPRKSRRGGHDILSGRQMTRRRRAESATLFDVRYER